MQERRAHVRFNVPVLIQFPDPASTKTERSYSYDISESGMRFPTPAQVQVGQQLALTLQLPAHEAPFHATGQVMWVREIARQGETQYEVGVRFLWVEDPDRQRMNQFFRGVLSPKL